MSTKKIENLTKRQKNIVGIVLFLLFLAFCTVVGWFIGKPMVEFVSRPEEFRAWVNSHGIFGRLAFIGMTVFQVVIALVPGEPLEIGAGYAFGAVEGTVLCLIGIGIGGMLVFYIVKSLGIRFVELFFSVDKIKSLKILQKSKRRDTLMFLVFFLPGTPKDLITYFAGLTDVKVSYFIFLTTLARIPSVVSSTVGGSALGVKSYLTAIIVFAVTLIISAVGWVIYKKIITEKKK